jgi:hypothetical protein
MEPLDRPLAAILVRARLVLGVAAVVSCTAEPSSAGPTLEPSAQPAPTEEARPDATTDEQAPPAPAPERPPESAQPETAPAEPAPVPVPPAPQAPVQEPAGVVSRPEPPKVEPNRTAPTCGPCCHGTSGCDRDIINIIEGIDTVDPMPQDRRAMR